MDFGGHLLSDRSREAICVIGPRLVRENTAYIVWQWVSQICSGLVYAMYFPGIAMDSKLNRNVAGCKLSFS